MRKKRFISGSMLAVMMTGNVLGNVLGNVIPVTANQTNEPGISTVFNQEGLWLTEIYQNDVDRSIKNNKREASGYENVHLYQSTTDLMEYVEITSTYDEPINFNDMYELCYKGVSDKSETVLTVTDMDGNSDITIQPGESIVIWNYRSDVSTGIPTEEEFREDMRIPDDAVILKAKCGVNWATSATFSLKTKADNNVISNFTATDKIHTMDGFSVELKIPDIGSEMEVYRVLNTPSAGYVYSGQLNGLANVTVPDTSTADGVYVTEVRPNDTNRSGNYGTESDVMECVEIINTTDRDIDLNNDYQVIYFVKEGSRKVLQLCHYDDAAVNHEGSSEECIVPAGGTAVLWCYRETTLSDYTSFPTENDFRQAYNIGDDVPVYIFANQSSLNNTNRGLEIYRIERDNEGNVRTRELVSNYCYVGNDDCKDNKSVELAVNPEGPEMLLYAANVTTSMGMVNQAQYAYLQDDGSALTLRLDDVVPESVMQGEEIRVKFYFDVTGSLPRTGITTYYRFDGEGSWYSVTEANRRVPNLYEALISADELFSHDYVEFYVSADNRYRSTLSDIYTVRVDKLNITDGIRTNISEGEEVNGIVSITANDGTDNSLSKIYVDGTECETLPMLEDGAYFTFHAGGRDSYFRNAITTTDNEIIASIGKWQYNILDGQAINIDNNYFAYNSETDTYDITLRFWAGTYGATVDEYMLPDANREDFTVTELALKLINGNVYYPMAIGPNNSETAAKTNLSTDYKAVHSIGDSTGMCPYMDVSFSIPASEVTAVGTEIDTNTLDDGEHTLKVTNGTSTEEIKFIVDNVAPEIELGVEDGSVLTGNIVLEPQIFEANTLEEVTILLDGNEINAGFETTAYNLGDGEHTIMVFAKDAVGNEAVKSATFTVEDATIVVLEAGTTNVTKDSAELYLTLQKDGSEAEAVFYKAEKVNTNNITTNTTSGILPYIQYTINVGDVNSEDTILANWDGTASNSDNTHASTMYVLNVETGSWDKIASADKDGSIKDAVFTAENHVKDGEATVIVQCTADSALPDLETSTDGAMNTNAAWDGTDVPEDYDFCFAWETDTQYYAEEWQYHFTNMNNWIVNNAEALKIKYVIHTGDIVDDVDMIYEWENADEAMGIFDKAGMAYGVLGGNHDTAAGLADYENYYTYFGEDRFESQPTYGGSYENNKGHYDLISENGQDFIIVYMSWNIYQEEIDWMNEVLQKYSDRKAILCFHTYTNVKTSSDTLLDYYGQLIQKYVVAKNPNVFAVLNGHYHGSSYETAMFDDDGDGQNDRTVYQICTDYQSGFEGGSEYIKFLYFDLDNNKIYMNSYSPYLDDFNYYDTEVHNLNVDGAAAIGVDQMVLDVEFSADEQSILEKQFSAYVCRDEKLGTATVDESTGRAAIQLSGLTEGTQYAWYATVTNENTGYVKTGIYEFKTTVSRVDNSTIIFPSDPSDVIESDTKEETEDSLVSSSVPMAPGTPDLTEKDNNGVEDVNEAQGSGLGETISSDVATGDSSMTWIYVLLGIALAAGGAVIFVTKKEVKDNYEK